MTAPRRFFRLLLLSVMGCAVWQNAFTGAQPDFRYSRRHCLSSNAISPTSLMERVKVGDMYTGKVVDIKPGSIGAIFDVDGTPFRGNVKVVNMGFEKRIKHAGDVYAVGEEVTAWVMKGLKHGKTSMTMRPEVTVGAEYTGEVISVNISASPTKVHIEFFIGSTKFTGVLFLDDHVEDAGKSYAVGDKVTARALAPERRPGASGPPTVLLSLDKERFESKALTEFSVGDTLSGKLRSRNKVYAIFDVGAVVNAKMDLSLFDIGNLNLGDSMDLRLIAVTKSALHVCRVESDVDSAYVLPGLEYTGQVVEVNPASIDIKFDTDGTSFFGKLHDGEMALEPGVERDYAIGDEVTARMLQNLKLPNTEMTMLPQIEIGTEYTGKVIKVHRSSIDVAFDIGSTNFTGWLHFSEMGIDRPDDEIIDVGDVYSLGDTVTARVLKSATKKEPYVPMSIRNAIFEKKRLSEFSVGDVVSGTLVGRNSWYAFFDVGAMVDAKMDINLIDDTVAEGGSMDVRLIEVGKFNLLVEVES